MGSNVKRRSISLSAELDDSIVSFLKNNPTSDFSRTTQSLWKAFLSKQNGLSEDDKKIQLLSKEAFEIDEQIRLLETKKEPILIHLASLKQKKEEEK